MCLVGYKFLGAKRPKLITFSSVRYVAIALAVDLAVEVVAVVVVEVGIVVVAVAVLMVSVAVAAETHLNWEALRSKTIKECRLECKYAM